MSLPQHIRDMIHTELDRADEPGPDVVTDKVAANLTDEQVQQIIRPLLRYAVHETIRSRRGTAPVGNGASDVGEMTRDPNRMQHYVPDKGWVFDADLTAEDCEAIAEQMAQRAEQFKARARYWRKRAAAIRSAGVDRWADVPEQLQVREAAA